MIEAETRSRRHPRWGLVAQVVGVVGVLVLVLVGVGTLVGHGLGQDGVDQLVSAADDSVAAASTLAGDAATRLGELAQEVEDPAAQEALREGASVAQDIRTDLEGASQDVGDIVSSLGTVITMAAIVIFGILLYLLLLHVALWTLGRHWRTD